MFHVLSLQRTASKSLVSSLATLCLPEKTAKLNGEPLSEMLHYWTKTGFRFSPTLSKPFGHQEDVVYYTTHPRFNDPSCIQFEYVEVGERDFGYRAIPVVRPTPEFHPSVLEVLGLLHTLPKDSHFVLKTQLAHILCSVPEHLRGHILLKLNKFHEDYGTTTIKLSRKSGLDWLCSMALTDASGVFIPCTAQSHALESFLKAPLTVPEDKLHLWVSMWNLHETAVSADYYVMDTDLARGFSLSTPHLEEPVDLAFPPHSTVREFSSADYSRTIANYDELLHVSKTLMVRGDE